MFRKLFSSLKDRLTPSSSPDYGCGEPSVENGKQVTCGKKDHQCDKCRLAWAEQRNRRAARECQQELDNGVKLERTKRGWRRP
ncbi:hypothetical protein LTR95_003853 [Oleoguttula sp. CCFEE 5521]